MNGTPGRDAEKHAVVVRLALAGFLESMFWVMPLPLMLAEIPQICLDRLHTSAVPEARMASRIKIQGSAWGVRVVQLTPQASKPKLFIHNIDHLGGVMTAHFTIEM